jgi:sigma-B regulation protein RsbU (phosphoserine phosphatase)
MKLTELLDRDEVERIVGGLSPGVSSPLFVVDKEGEIIAEAGRAELGCLLEEGFSVEVGIVRCAEEACPHFVGQTCSPIEVYGDRLGFAVGCGGQAARAASFLGDFLSRRARDEFELNSLSQEILGKYEEINLLYEVSGTLGAVFDTEMICKLVLEKAVQVIGARKASVMLLDDAEGVLRIAAEVGIPQLASVAVKLGEGISGRVAQSGKPLLMDNIEDLTPDWRRKVSDYNTKSFISVPMTYSTERTEGKVLGVINMADKKSGQMFTSEDLKLLTAIASQAAIAIYNCQVVEKLKEAERVKREMEIARRIQMSLLPAKPPKVEGLELAGRCVPASEVGGDYYDFFSADGQVGFLVADVSGHSVGSALMMAITRSVLRSEIARGKSPAKVLASTNAAMYEDLSQAELFITAFYASYDKGTRTLTYANGGHNLPFVWRAGEGQCALLDAEGMLIGVLKDVFYEERTMELQPGDVLVLYTDGVTEATTEKEEPFGEERLYQVVKEKGHLSAHELLDEIYRQVRQFSGGLAQRDDITMIIVQVL